GFYEDNLAAYLKDLRALDAWVERQTAGLANRKVVTNHDAFGYYLDRYHLQLVGSVIPSFDSSAELSGRDIRHLVAKITVTGGNALFYSTRWLRAPDIRELVARIRATGAKAIFSETSLPPRAAETIGREAGVRVVTGEGALYGDSLGPPGYAGAGSDML